MQFSVLTTGDVVVSALALGLAAVELWMFQSRRSAGLKVAPAFLLEYGFLAFAGSLVVLHFADSRHIHGEIHRSRDRLWDEHMAVISGAGEGILGLDPEGRVIVWNPALERIMGLTFKDVAGGGCSASRCRAPRALTREGYPRSLSGEGNGEHDHAS